MPMNAQAGYHDLLLQRHDSAAHLLAEAMYACFPAGQLVHKHINAEGFLCEFALEDVLLPADLARLEQYVAYLIARNWPCQRVYWSHSRALEYFRRLGRASQLVQLEQASNEEAFRCANIVNYPHLCHAFSEAKWPEDVLVYQHGEYIELCPGSHVEYAGEVGECQLVRVEVVSESEGLQRIYGVVEEFYNRGSWQ